MKRLRISVLVGLANFAAGFALAQPGLEPTYLGTAGLERARVALLAQAEGGTWPRLGAGPTLLLGDRHDAVATLRARLAADGEAASAPVPDPLLFDAELEGRVRAFQERHGLEPDGRVGPATRTELDRTPLDRRGASDATRGLPGGHTLITMPREPFPSLGALPSQGRPGEPANSRGIEP